MAVLRLSAIGSCTQPPFRFYFFLRPFIPWFQEAIEFSRSLVEACNQNRKTKGHRLWSIPRVVCDQGRVQPKEIELAPAPAIVHSHDCRRRLKTDPPVKFRSAPTPSSASALKPRVVLTITEGSVLLPGRG